MASAEFGRTTSGQFEFGRTRFWYLVALGSGISRETSRNHFWNLTAAVVISAEAPDQFGSLPEVLLARCPWPTHLGPVYEKPISQGVFRQSAWPSHTAACGYLAIAK